MDDSRIELSLDEINWIKERSIKMQNGEDSGHMADGELSKDELMDVAGGYGEALEIVWNWFASW